MQKSNQTFNFFLLPAPALCSSVMRSSHGAPWAAAPGGSRLGALDVSFAMVAPG